MRFVSTAALILAAAACGADEPSSGASSEGAGGAGASAGSTGAGGSGGGVAGATGTGATGGAGLPACVTDVVLLAEAGQSFECSFSLPAEFVDSDINLVLEVGGAQTVLCWRASSQGCDVGGFPGGWWYSFGDEVALCDSTCTTLIETGGTKLYLWVGCPNDTCL